MYSDTCSGASVSTSIEELNIAGTEAVASERTIGEEESTAADLFYTNFLDVPASDENFVPGEYPYVWRDNFRLCTGPHEIVSVEDKNMILVVDSKGPKSFAVSSCKRAHVPVSIQRTEVLPAGDLGATRPEMFNAIRKEMANLMRRGTFTLVVFPDDDSTRSAKFAFNAKPSKYVLSLKHAF